MSFLFARTFLQRVPKSRRAPIEARRFSFLLCQKDQAARLCPSFGTEPYIEFTLNRNIKIEHTISREYQKN
ncbi:hypothetical protein C4Q31_15500 [Leptospira borgpetersenii serovar Ceylonica]|nr:hypothetical protein C4Q31_15500 [Leptospira borgpetersenii serovar Ceylonica]QVK47857.1 hypothetical protein FH601_00225 [Leptospira borgpetersenii]QVK50779.1 hypothetical protein FH600_14010 [Leptospira borgpetersenii]QVK53966.1 hypothetical protein FH599_14000 [Leptospira borgpetersenii]QVK57157.1 hypothetical protein FH596_14005 [Leptospira borgpetersenii]